MSRIQLALNVENLDQSVAFYGTLFATSPAKVKPGYANFAISEPPLKLVLIENPGQGGSINHLGVEVADTAQVDATQTRLASAGLASTDERGITCCYAKQTSFGSKAHPTASSGRSTPSWPTATPSLTPRPPSKPAATTPRAPGSSRPPPPAAE